jgi:Flp pilus assembly protein TadG
MLLSFRSNFIFHSVFCRFRKDRRGSTVVEFAIIAPIFFALMFAIIEVAFSFFAGQVLESAAQDSFRKIFTGQAQAANLTPAQFKNDFCSRIVALFDCQGGVYIDVESYPSSSSVVPNLSDPIDANGKFDPSAFKYSPGGNNDFVIVRIFYQWPVFVTGFGLNTSNLAGGKTRLLSVTGAFRNEPFSLPASSPSTPAPPPSGS